MCQYKAYVIDNEIVVLFWGFGSNAVKMIVLPEVVGKRPLINITVEINYEGN